MLVTNQFVFLHLHKSGGSFINQLISQFFPEARLIGYHFPRNKLPKKYQHLPIIGVVRNPWDYYVSWYSFQQQMASSGALFQIISNNGQRDFNASIEQLLNLSEDDELFERVRAVLPHQFIGRGLNLTRHCLDEIKNSQQGFYSFLFNRIYGDVEDIHFMRMENLRNDCLTIMQDLQIAVTSSFIDALKNTPKINTSKHSHYSNYYQATLQAAVLQKDQQLIDYFAYQFEGKSKDNISSRDG